MKNILDVLKKKDRQYLAGILTVIVAFCFFATGLSGCKSEKAVSPRPNKKAIGLKKVPAQTKKMPVVDKTEESDLLASKRESSDQEDGSDELDMQQKRDPFQSFIAIKKEEVVQTKKPARMILTPLQRNSLYQLKVVGVIHGGIIKKALMEDDVGKGYVVSVGDVIGNQGGKIVSIKTDRIIIEESFGDALGRSKVRQITKKLFPTEEKSTY